jgi:hypothetical protein
MTSRSERNTPNTVHVISLVDHKVVRHRGYLTLEEIREFDQRLSFMYGDLYQNQQCLGQGRDFNVERDLPSVIQSPLRDKELEVVLQAYNGARYNPDNFTVSYRVWRSHFPDKTWSTKPTPFSKRNPYTGYSE